MRNTYTSKTEADKVAKEKKSKVFSIGENAQGKALYYVGTESGAKNARKKVRTYPTSAKKKTSELAGVGTKKPKFKIGDMVYSWWFPNEKVEITHVSKSWSKPGYFSYEIKRLLPNKDNEEFETTVYEFLLSKTKKTESQYQQYMKDAGELDGTSSDRYEVLKIYRKSGRRVVLASGLTREQAQRKVSLYPDSQTHIVVFFKTRGTK